MSKSKRPTERRRTSRKTFSRADLAGIDYRIGQAKRRKQQHQQRAFIGGWFVVSFMALAIFGRFVGAW